MFSLPLTLDNFLPLLKLPVGAMVAGHLAPVTWPPILESFSPMRELLSLLDLKKKKIYLIRESLSCLVWLGRWGIG